MQTIGWVLLERDSVPMQTIRWDEVYLRNMFLSVVSQNEVSEIR